MILINDTALDQTKAAVGPAEDNEYVPVQGRDRQSIELERQIEARAAAKTASDYVHIIWAYGIIWSLFAAYGLYLWRRATRLRFDMQQLERRLPSDR